MGWHREHCGGRRAEHQVRAAGYRASPSMQEVLSFVASTANIIMATVTKEGLPRIDRKRWVN